MNDAAFNLLASSLHSACEQTLWLADENLLDVALPAGSPLQVITNRFDLYQRGQTAGWQIWFSDFDLSAIEDQSLSRVIYRVSKEKALVHHLINQAFRCLKPGGELLIAGDKGEGIKSYIDKAKKLFAGHCNASKADKNTWLANLIRPEEAGCGYLDDQNYPQLREAMQDAQGQAYQSKPGQFGWNKIDKGSALLIEQLAGIPLAPPESILDLGCGYGYLSVQAHRLFPQAQQTCTDNNAAALQSCQANLPDAQVVAANCGNQISGKFDLILCNPPFHAGFAVENSLTERFIQASRRLLADKGCAVFVVNQHIPLERKAREYFASIDTLCDNGHFKVIRLAQPQDT